MIARWTSLVPSQMRSTRSSRKVQRGLSAIDVAAVAHVSDPHETSLVIDLVQDPVVTNPDPEQPVGPREHLHATWAGIVTQRLGRGLDPRSHRAVQLAK
jgi:hypothetical protein